MFSPMGGLLARGTQLSPRSPSPAVVGEAPRSETLRLEAILPRLRRGGRLGRYFKQEYVFYPRLTYPPQCRPYAVPEQWRSPLWLGGLVGRGRSLLKMLCASTRVGSLLPTVVAFTLPHVARRRVPHADCNPVYRNKYVESCRGAKRAQANYGR